MRHTFPGGQAHIGLAGVGTLRDQFGGGLAGDGKVEFILDNTKKLQRLLGLGVVIGRPSSGWFVFFEPVA